MLVSVVQPIVVENPINPVTGKDFFKLKLEKIETYNIRYQTYDNNKF